MASLGFVFTMVPRTVVTCGMYFGYQGGGVCTSFLCFATFFPLTLDVIVGHGNGMDRKK